MSPPHFLTPRMSLPILTRHLIQTKLTAYCAGKLPPEQRDQIRLEIEFDGENVTLSESRPHIRQAGVWTRLPVARFRFNLASGTWTLYRPKLGQSETWQIYPGKPERDLDKLIRLLETDESGAFWG